MKFPYPSPEKSQTHPPKKIEKVKDASRLKDKLNFLTLPLKRAKPNPLKRLKKLKTLQD